MEYIQRLRQYIGHAPILMVGAAILLLDGQNRLLLMKRSDSGRWGVPGGATEPGEAVENAARREILEETGLEVGDMSLFGIFSGPELFYKYPNGDEVYNVTIVYLSRNVDGDIHLNDEHTQWNWFTLDDIPDELSPPIEPIIEKFKDDNFKRQSLNVINQTIVQVIEEEDE